MTDWPVYGKIFANLITCLTNVGGVEARGSKSSTWEIGEIYDQVGKGTPPKLVPASGYRAGPSVNNCRTVTVCSLTYGGELSHSKGVGGMHKGLVADSKPVGVSISTAFTGSLFSYKVAKETRKK